MFLHYLFGNVSSTYRFGPFILLFHPYICIKSYSPSPLSTASIIAFMASSSSSPSQISSISSPDFTHAPRHSIHFRICCSVIVIHEFYFAFVSACYVTEHPCRSEMQSVGFVIVTFCLIIIVFSPFLSIIRSGRSDCFHLSLSDCCSGFPPSCFTCSALSFQA